MDKIFRLLTAIGFFVLGIIGIFLPVMPGVVFFLAGIATINPKLAKKICVKIKNLSIKK